MQVIEAFRLLGTAGPQDARREASAACIREYLVVLAKVLVGKGDLHSQDLEDAVGAAFVRCLKAAPGFRGRSDPQAKKYLMKTLRSATVGLYKPKNRSQRIERQATHIDVHEWEERCASAETVGGISAVPDYVLMTELRDPDKKDRAKFKKRRQRSRADAKQRVEPVFAQMRASFRMPKSEEFCAVLERAVSSAVELNQTGLSKEVIWLLICLQPKQPSWLRIWA